MMMMIIIIIYLGSDCYLRTLTYLKDCRVQTKQTYPKPKLQNAPTFNGNENHSDVCLLLVIKKNLHPPIV